MRTFTRDNVTVKPKHNIRTKKCTVTVIWNPRGFHVINKCPTGTTINNDYFTTNVLAPLQQKIFLDERKLNTKRPTIHLDNRWIQRSGATEVYITEHNMIRFKHPPYSPDLAPSLFSFLRTIKERLKDIQMLDEENLFYPLKEFLNGIPRRELAKVFGTWMNRLMAVSRGMETVYHEE
jgi:histone-lysine N-methyltransferase SETMAR